MPPKNSNCQVYIDGVPFGEMTEIEFLSDDADDPEDNHIKSFDFDKEYGFSLGG